MRIHNDDGNMCDMNSIIVLKGYRVYKKKYTDSKTSEMQCHSPKRCNKSYVYL